MDNYIGEIRLFAGDYAPDGWALCNGQTLPVSQNQALFALIGGTFGGDGHTTFKLPDLRGKAAAHIGQNSFGDRFTLGQALGTETETLNQQQMPSHYHLMNVSTESGDTNTPTGALLAVGTINGYRRPTESDRITFHQQSIGRAGSGDHHENMMPYIVLNYIIATTGIFPSQS